MRAAAGPNVTVLGFQDDATLVDHMQRARAFVFAAEEDFGITPVEAQACGTPVIAYGCGSVPEVIDDGVTGFIVANDDEAIDAISRIPSLNRRGVRRRFDERFSSVAMARRYLDLYAQLVGARPERGVALAASA